MRAEESLLKQLFVGRQACGNQRRRLDRTDAKNLLLHSVAIKPQTSTWKNLASVHERLGEKERQKLAMNEVTILEKTTGKLGKTKIESGPIAWVDAKTFEENNGQAGVPAAVAKSPQKQKPATQKSRTVRTRIAEGFDRLKFWK